jgi:hypothetical protein
MLIVTPQANRLDRFGASRTQWSFRGASVGRRVPRPKMSSWTGAADILDHLGAERTGAEGLE